MEGIRNADVVVGLVRAFSHHDVGNHAGQVRLIRESDQIEQKIDLLVEIVQHSDRTLGNLHAWKYPVRRPLGAPFDFTNAFQIAVESRAICGAQFTLKRLWSRSRIRSSRLSVCRAICDPFLRRGLAEQLVEDFLRVVLHRKRRVGVAERQRACKARRCRPPVASLFPKILPRTAAWCPGRSSWR